MSNLSPARALALEALSRADERDAYVRELLSADRRMAALDARDAAMARRLALGVTAARGTLDQALDRFLSKPGKVSPRVRMALRVAAFELLYLSTPERAAVSQGVELVRSQARSASGLANAVLRRVAEGREAFFAAEDVPPADRALHALARRAGLPLWLAERVSASIRGRAAEAFASSELEPAPVWLCAHPSVDEGGGFAGSAEDETFDAGVGSESSAEGGVGVGFATAKDGALGAGAGFAAPTEGTAPAGFAGSPEGAALGARAIGLAGCYEVRHPVALAASELARRDMLAVSDFAAQLVAVAATRPGSCLELGAGRGTKTYVMCAAAARAGIRREHVAVDLYERKCELNRERLARAGFSAACVATDARDLRGLDAAAHSAADDGCPAPQAFLAHCVQGFDTVLLDAPCSGTGTMRRHPEIPWRLAAADVDPDNPAGLPVLQLALLREASRAVAPGGELFYATCSVLREEDEDVLVCFLASEEGAGFSVARFSDAEGLGSPSCTGARAFACEHETEEGYLRTAPALGGCDGHFCARLVRRA